MFMYDEQVVSKGVPWIMFAALMAQRVSLTELPAHMVTIHKVLRQEPRKACGAHLMVDWTSSGSS